MIKNLKLIEKIVFSLILVVSFARGIIPIFKIIGASIPSIVFLILMIVIITYYITIIKEISYKIILILFAIGIIGKIFWINHYPLGNEMKYIGLFGVAWFSFRLYMEGINQSSTRIKVYFLAIAFIAFIIELRTFTPYGFAADYGRLLYFLLLPLILFLKLEKTVVDFKTDKLLNIILMPAVFYAIATIASLASSIIILIGNLILSL